MAKASRGKLKLFKTVVGFHDAYVAAPSQKAALAAWGASTDLFSAGLAERIDNGNVCAPAFDNPGTIVSVKRGTTKEWTARARPKSSRPSKTAMARKRLSERLDKLADRHGEALAALDRQAEALREKRSALETKQAGERSALQAELDALDE